MFDAVMSVGFGACAAQASREQPGELTGESHNNGIRTVNFRGTTGSVRFGSSTFRRKGTRADDSRTVRVNGLK